MLRWANPTGGDHIGELNTLISRDKLLFTHANGAEVQVTSDANYTYLFQPVPEPGSFLLSGPAFWAWPLTRGEGGVLCNGRTRSLARSKLSRELQRIRFGMG